MVSSIDYSKNDGFIDSLFLRPPDDVVSFAFFGTWFQSFDTCERKEKKGAPPDRQSTLCLIFEDS